MNWKGMLTTVITVIVALLIYHMFVSKLFVKDSFESDAVYNG